MDSFILAVLKPGADTVTVTGDGDTPERSMARQEPLKSFWWSVTQSSSVLMFPLLIAARLASPCTFTVKHGIFGDGIVLSVNNERKSAEVDFGGRTRNILWKFIEKAE